MIACNFKVKDVKEFKSLSGLNCFMRYVMCAIDENKRDGARISAADWNRILGAAIDRYHELESEVNGYE